MAKKQLTERLLPMDKIDEPGGVIRLDIDHEQIKSLAESINAIGLLQAILVRPVKDRYEIIYGHRRYLATKLNGSSAIRATVKEISDIQADIMRATENMERVDITPIEEAAIYTNLIKTRGLSRDKVAKMMGKTSAFIKRRMDYLSMPACLQKAIHEKQINLGVADTLWQLGDENEIEYYLGFAIDNGATVATVRQWVNDVFDNRRRARSDVGRGEGYSNPIQPKPVYVPCDLCEGPMNIGEETIFRTCPKCTASLNEATETTQK